jgi:hypothetical protein
MDDQWAGIADAIQSSDPEQVNEALDRIKQMDPDERARLFDVGFDELRTIYADSDDGYVRQSTVRIIEQLTPGMAATFLIEDEDRLTDETGEGLQQRIDAICGFLLETIEDEDGRVRQSTKRGLKDVYRSYDAFEDDDTIASLVTELDDRAEQSSGKQHDHLLDTKEDAEFFLQSDEARLMQGLQRLSDRSQDTQSASRAENDRWNSHAFGLQNPSAKLPEPLESVLPDTAVPVHELRALEERDNVVHVVILLPIETGFGVVSERFMIQYVDAGYILENIPEQGWEVIEQIDGMDKSETELLAALASEARDWHAEIADIAAMASGQRFDEAGIEAMNATLNQELRQKGYSDL